MRQSRLLTTYVNTKSGRTAIRRDKYLRVHVETNSLRQEEVGQREMRRLGQIVYCVLGICPASSASCLVQCSSSVAVVWARGQFTERNSTYRADVTPQAGVQQ
jgi:hypothetical protein